MANTRLNACGEAPYTFSMTNGDPAMYANIAAKASPAAMA